MNEHIRKLLTKAGAEVKVYGGVKVYVDKSKLDVEKFAELIIQECVWQVVKDDQVPHDIQILVGERIKQHFGVEE